MRVFCLLYTFVLQFMKWVVKLFEDWRRSGVVRRAFDPEPRAESRDPPSTKCSSTPQTAKSNLEQAGRPHGSSMFLYKQVGHVPCVLSMDS